MRRIASLALLVAAASVCLSAQTPKTAPKAQSPKPSPTSQKLTNSDVVQMAGAGLSEQIIVSAIQQSTARDFDLSPMGLVALKKAGVTDAVILTMQNPEARAAATAASKPIGSAAENPRDSPASAPATPATADGVPPLVAAEDGVYFDDGQKLVRIEAKAPYQTRTGSTAVSRLTLGIKKAKLNAMLPGLAADVQVTRAPQFYVHVAESESIGEYYLIAFTPNQGQGRRQLEIGSAGLGKLQAGFAEKDLFLVETKRLQKDVYLLTPKIALSAGEYGLLVVPQATGSGQTAMTPRKIFDFGVR